MKTVSYNGLRPRQTYEEQINYLQAGQETIRYPDREAKQIRNSPFLTQFDGIGQSSIEEQQLNKWIEEEKQIELQKVALSSNQSIAELRALQTPPKRSGSEQFRINTPTPRSLDFLSPTSIEEEERLNTEQRKARLAQIIEKAKTKISSSTPEILRNQTASSSSTPPPPLIPASTPPPLIPASTPSSEPANTPGTSSSTSLQFLQHPDRMAQSKIDSYSYKKLQNEFEKRGITPPPELMVKGRSSNKKDLLTILHEFDTKGKPKGKKK
jgi:hypothetical protein